MNVLHFKITNSFFLKANTHKSLDVLAITGLIYAIITAILGLLIYVSGIDLIKLEIIAFWVCSTIIIVYLTQVMYVIIHIFQNIISADKNIFPALVILAILLAFCVGINFKTLLHHSKELIKIPDKYQGKAEHKIRIFLTFSINIILIGGFALFFLINFQNFTQWVGLIIGIVLFALNLGLGLHRGKIGSFKKAING